MTRKSRRRVGCVLLVIMAVALLAALLAAILRPAVVFWLLLLWSR